MKIQYKFLVLTCLLIASEIPQSLTAQTFDESLYSGLEYRLVGPFRGGRSCTVTGVVGKPDLYYFGSVGGGVWKTDDGGMTYENISDGYFGGSIGAVAVAPSDPNVLFAGQGEKTVRGNVSSGFGIWKSEDAGSSWKFVGLEKTSHVGRIRIHPTNPDIVYVAAMGNLWKPTPDRGVFKSTDGGESWKKILFANEDAGAVDLVIDPGNPRVLYASTWNVRRTKHDFSSGGPGSDIWKSTDAGNTWKRLTESADLPSEPRGIIGLSVSPVNPDRVYALIEADGGGLFRSDDAGKSWRRVSRNRALRSRAWYYTRVYADTQDEDKVYVMNVSYGVSKDGGETFSLHNAPHGDHHDLWIDPTNNQRMIIGDDGGAQISNDAGENWTTYYNQPTAQFYRIATDDVFPFRIYGAQQDNSSIRISHRNNSRAISEDDWEVTAGGESAYHAIDPNNPDIVYGGNYKGYLYRYDHSTNQNRAINVWPYNPAGSGVEVMKYRFNWNFPVMFSMHEPNKLFAFSNHVHVTTNEGQTWQTVSPDLTRNDPETQRSSGGPITQDNTGVEFYANILTAKESPHQAGTWWTGSDDGMIHLTKDNAANWSDVTPKQAPHWIMWNSIDPHPTNPAGAYLAGTMYKSGDYRPYLYKTLDHGKSWVEITSGIDPAHFTRVIRADPGREGLLYAGTEYGMYISFDDGASWQPFQLNLPLVPITDLQVKQNSLVVATQGRSFWIIDDLTPLHQLNQEITRAPSTLFKPKDTYRLKVRGWGGGNAQLTGENHPNGVICYYYHGDDIEGDVALEFLEEDGTVIKSFVSSKKGDRVQSESGMHAFTWDLRYPDAVSFEGLVLYSANTRGPVAPPGTYVVRLSTPLDTITQSFTVLKDPRIKSTNEDLQAQFEFLIDVRDKLSEAHQAIIDIRSMREDLDYLEKKLKEQPAGAAIIAECKKLRDSMSVIENTIHETRNEARQDPLNFGIKLNNHLAYLASHESAGDFRPTDQGVAFKEVVSAQIDAEILKLEKVWYTSLPMINRMIKEADIQFILPMSAKRKGAKP